MRLAEAEAKPSASSILEHSKSKARRSLRDLISITPDTRSPFIHPGPGLAA
jgi:hypothetical protein